MEFQHDNSAPVKNGSATTTKTKAAQNGAAKDHSIQPKKDSTTAPVQSDKPKHLMMPSNRYHNLNKRYQ